MCFRRLVTLAFARFVPTTQVRQYRHRSHCCCCSSSSSRGRWRCLDIAHSTHAQHEARPCGRGEGPWRWWGLPSLVGRPFVEGSQHSPGSSSLRKQAPCYPAGTNRMRGCRVLLCVRRIKYYCGNSSLQRPPTTQMKPRHTLTQNTTRHVR